MHNQLHRDQLPPLPLIARDFITIRHCDQCHTMLGADASTCSSCRSTELSKVPSSGTPRSWRGPSSSCPQLDGTDFTPVTGAIVALDRSDRRMYARVDDSLAPGARGKLRVRDDRMNAGQPTSPFFRTMSVP